ncbi:MAG: glucose-6-phosphate isomerase [Gammaproteobacteria bacterium]|jgi:glucose-6-phosphate isomerase
MSLEKTDSLRSRPAWSRLVTHAKDNRAFNLEQAFLADRARYRDFSLEVNDLLVDYSRCLVTRDTIQLLVELAEEAGLGSNIEALLAGEIVNGTERRAALHTALRGTGPAIVDGKPVEPLVSAELDLFLAYADAVRSGARVGYSGKRIERVINIGIGGSDLGPRLVSDALQAAEEPVRVRYVAGIDGQELERSLRGADPETTLFVICSKTFSTLETRLNADAAKSWLLAKLPAEAVTCHFAAVSVNHAAMDEFGIAKDARFSIWDWVGGRFSLWSAIGVSSAIAIGGAAFRQLLAGAAGMDQHFRSRPLAENIPVVLGLLSVWQQSFLGITDHVILPYDQRLELLPAYLQQLFMESLGKSVCNDGSPVYCSTGASVWGTVGSHSQHSFAQLLHQGTASIQVDYIGTVAGPRLSVAGGQVEGLANMIAQSESLALGQDESSVQESLAASGKDAAEIERLSAHRVHPGNRPSVMLLLRELSPRMLGALLAMYEHQVYVQAMIWDINPFDQWGVELGKVRAGQYAEYLKNGDTEKLPGIGQSILTWQRKSSG